MFTAVLDTCVLYPATCRDFLLSLAVEGIYRPAWSSEILAELQEHEQEKLSSAPGLGIDAPEAARRAGRLVTIMRQAFPDACVQGWEPLEGTFGLPDPDDEHVVAAAVVGGAGAIVTANLKDFPPGLVPPRIDVVAPAQFALDQVGQDPLAGLRAVQAMAARNQREPDTVEAILATISSRYDMADAADVIRQADRDAGDGLR